MVLGNLALVHGGTPEDDFIRFGEVIRCEMGLFKSNFSASSTFYSPGKKMVGYMGPKGKINTRTIQNMIPGVPVYWALEPGPLV